MKNVIGGIMLLYNMFNMKKIRTFFIFSFFMFNSYAFSATAEKANCYTLEINRIATINYLNYKGIPASGREATLNTLNALYSNFIEEPSSKNQTNRLFTLVKNTSNFEKNTGFLTCGFNINDAFLCDSNKLYDNTNCSKTYTDTIDGKEQTIDIKDCISYNDAVNKGINACYPQNHICNKYKEDKLNKYYDISSEKVGNGTVVNKFYIYQKNINSDEVNGNCNLELFSCDFSVNNEDTNAVNLVNSNSTDINNKKFIENILSISAFEENKRFFKYVGVCENKNCININNEKEDYNTIITKPYYFKYKITNSNNNIIYYYEKNISIGSGFDTKGSVCKGYLPKCIDLKPIDTLTALYDNSKNSNNKKAREKFYGNNKDTVREENLWFVNNNSFADFSCLAITDGDNNTLNYDIGYCSDLINSVDKNGNKTKKLRYLGGVVNNKGIPNCYLKSCIDLTSEEIETIVTTGGEGKYCSEYYWLENNKKFKYFPKENPVYCSDIKQERASNFLVFEGGRYNYKKDNYSYSSSYGGGKNKNGSNCYLKNCFSLNDNERDAVANANATNIGFEIERAYKNDVVDFNRDNLPKYCDDGFLFNKNFKEFENFDYLNLNVIPCYKFSDEQLKAIKKGSGKGVVFTDLLKEYDTNKTNYFCRGNYEPLHKLPLNKQTINSNFLETTFVIADERDETKYKYSEILTISKSASIEQINTRLASDYNKIEFSEVGNFSNKYLYSNICNNVDNSFLAYNADIYSLRNQTIMLGSNVKINYAVNDIKNKYSEYYKCISQEITKYDIHTSNNAPQECKNCEQYYNDSVDDSLNYCLSNGGATKDEDDNYVLSKKNTSKCSNYIPLEYSCKQEYCKKDGLNDNQIKACNIDNNLSNYVIDCNKYLSVNNSEDEIFDCSLFTGTKEDDLDKYNIYSLYFKDKDNGKQLVTEDNIQSIVKACQAALPLEDERPEIVEPDELYSLIKPFYKGGYNFNNDANKKYGTNDIGRYSCSLYNKPVKAKDTFNSGLWGCKAPNKESSYFYTNSNSTYSINDIYFNEEIKDLNNVKPYITVCSRYPEDIYSDNNCGQRNGSIYNDKCLQFVVSKKNGSSVDLEDSKSGTWYFTNSTGGSRFRTETHGRDLFVFRDFYTYYKCTSSNIPDKSYYDEKSAGLITAEAIGIGTISGSIAGAIACAICAIFTAGSCCAFVIPAAIAVAVAAAISSMLLARTKEYNLSLQNDIYYPRDYYDVNSGFLSRANITNNDDYIYRYYRRADNIEDDIKNKLELNTDSDGKRYFHNNTLSKDIVEACNIKNLIWPTNKESIGPVKPNDSAVKYSFYKLKEDGSRDGECIVSSKESVEKCLHKTQLDCLRGYGVKFVFNSDIDDNFIMTDGTFLEPYQDGDAISTKWGKKGNNNYNWLPLQIVPYTESSITDKDLKDRKECSLKKYGDSYGSLVECRGFEHDNIFYTESQALKLPLFSSPVFFYTLITPKNIPELFNPTLYLKYFYLFSKYKDGTVKDNDRSEYLNPDDVILDFYNPKLQYSYDFVNGVSDSDYINILSKDNEFIAEIKKDKKISYAYEVKYKSELIEERKYGFALNKTFIQDAHNTYTPRVCTYGISVVSKKNNSLNTKYDAGVCSGTGCYQKNDSQDFIVIDNDVECFDRAIPFLSDFAFAPSINMNYKNPVINVYLKPQYSTISEVIADKNTYSMTYDNSIDITTNAENSIQGFGLNFERSYCSKAYYEYYKYVDLLTKEEKKTEGKDLSKISLYKKTISSIENTIIPDCNAENGNEIEILVNEDKIKTINDVSNKKDVVYKKTVKVKQNNELYGGFNEICVAEYDINNILNIYNKQNNTSIELPRVLVYKDINKTQRKTKCVLNESSRSKKECLVGDKAYILCKTGEENESNSNCREFFDTTNLKKVYVKEIDCNKYLGVKNITEDNIEYVKACFKGGFNYIGNVYKKLNCKVGEIGCQELEDTCSCQIVNNSSDYNTLFYDTRTITSREYGLCVDLAKPNICPAVKYYDSSKQYVDNSLFLGVTEKKGVKGLPTNYYEQHYWRTDEKQVGILPSVFYTKSLGHAEFPASVYCKETDDCIGGEKTVTGECNGYWKESQLGAPVATCEAIKINDNTTVYEYELKGNACERYSCPALGYKEDEVTSVVDEQDINLSNANFYTNEESEAFSNIQLTDFTSYTNNEEINANSIDKRGSSNGFAIWEKTKISSDYAKEITSRQCLTGFAPAGTTRLLKNINDITSDDYKYIDFNNINNSKYSDIINLYIKRQERFNEIIQNNNNYPKRICNQLGEWMTVNDVYNLLLIDKNNANNNYYYNNNENAWVKTYETTNNGNVLENITGLTEEELLSGYCERLVCEPISSNNENYYKTEFTIDGKYTNKKLWKHSGGAEWDRVSAARNSSNKITTQSVETFYSSKNIYNIMRINNNDNAVNNRYKYVKKVYGRCETEYGYYNRGTEFVNNDFDAQLSTLRASVTNDKKTSAIDPRNIDLINNNSNVTKPSRHCTSNGQWSGIFNSCVRACEMMDIYHTEYSNSLLNNGVNTISNKNYFAENSDIKTINLKSNLTNNEKENKFKEINFDKVKDNYNNFSLGDYLTGGASWPRTLVDVNSNVLVDTDKNSSKYGLRYVEVEAECDSSYNGDGGKIRTFVNRSLGIKPTRRCYEDGSWGQVKSDTRCVLYENCRDYAFTLQDLAELMYLYNRYTGDERIDNINLHLTALAYDGDKIVDINVANNKNIYKFSGTNSTPNNAISFNMIKSIDNSYIRNESVDENAILACNPDPKSTSNCKYSSICNMSTPNISAKYIQRWSLFSGSAYDKGKDSKSPDLGLYFIPLTCSNPTNSSSFYNVNYLNRIELVDKNSIKDSNNREFDKYYVKDSNLNYVYNALQSISKIYYKNNNANSSVENESNKRINIGTQQYGSYQLHYKCKDNLFYNDLSSSDGKINYYNKNIIFECKNIDDNNVKTPKFTYKSDNISSKDKDYFITIQECLPKTCGKSINDNPYQDSNWSEAKIKEIDSSYGISDKSNESLLSCDSGYAFVLKDDKINENSVIYYTDNSNMNTEYKNRKFVSSIKGQCTNQNKQEGYINGKQISINSYDYNRYGEIEVSKLPKTFCNSLDKTNCVTIDPVNNKNDENTLFRNTVDFKEKYCVRMACPGKNLKFENGEIVYNKNGCTGTGCFSLPNDYYTFNSNVVIQSMNDDYNNSYNIKEITIDNIYKQYGKDITGNMCSSNQDIYNIGAKTEFDIYQYVDSLGDSARNEALLCFDNLETTDSINENGGNGYSKITNNVYVKYSESYDKLTTINSLRKLKTDLNNYIKNNTELNNIKNNVADRIVNNIMFNGTEPLNSGEILTVNVLKNKLNNGVSDAKNVAKNTTIEYIKNNIKNKNISYYCSYNSDSKITYKEVTESDLSSKLNLLENLQKYKTYFGDNSNEKFYLVTDSNGNEYITISIENNDTNVCNETVNNYSVNSIVGKYGTVDSDANSGLCFYKIDSNKVVKKSSLSNDDLNKLNIDSNVKIVDCDINACVTSELAGEINYNNKKYTISSVDNTCSNSSYISVNTVKEAKPIYVNINEYINKYDELYETNIENFKTNTKNQIINGTLSKDTNYVNLYNKYYNYYSISGFLSKSDDNINNYYQYINYKYGEENYYNSNFNFDKDSVTRLDISESSEAETEGNITTTFDACNYDGCKKGSCISNNDDVKCDYTSSKTTLTGDLKSYFDAVFNNSITDKQESILNNIDSSITKLNNEISICNNVYTNYITTKKQNSNNTNNNYFKSGLFMVMQCTPDGWRVYDKPECKDRCSGDSSTLNLDPAGVGNWNVKLKVSNLRYGRKVKSSLNSHRSQGCLKNGTGTKAGEITVTCGNDKKINTYSYSKKGKVTGYHFWQGPRCDTETYIWSEDGDKTISCSGSWTQRALEEVMGCSPNGSFWKKRNSGSDGKGNVGYNNMTYIEHIITDI